MSASLARTDAATLANGGEMDRLIREHDWASTPLGPMEGWPAGLKVAVRLMLTTRHPMVVWWGPELIQFYNDGYAESLGPEKHPSGLGARFREFWAEIWDMVGPEFEQVLAGGAPVWREDQLIPIIRHGERQEVWWSYSLSPIDDPEAPNGVGGLVAIVRETTREVLARQDAQERDRVLFEGLESGFCIVEVDQGASGGRIDYRVVDANPAFYQQTGFPEAILNCWLREAAPALEEHWFDIYGRVARTGEPERFEQGSETLGRWFDVYAFRVGEAERGRVAILFNDISARRNVELRLRESEERFRNMADSAPVMVWTTDPDGACTYLNRSWYDFTGQTEADALGLGWLDATHPADKEGAEQVFLDANEARRPFRLEYRLRRADGSYRWAIDAAAPRFDPQGAFLGYVGTVIDIDERREAEERVQALANAVPAFVWFASPDGRIHFLNDRWYEYTGQTLEEAIPDGWTAALHPDDVERTARLWANARARGETYEVEVRYRRRDGAYRWYIARAEPQRDATGEITAWFGTSADIHDRRTAEADLRELNATLGRRIAEALAERNLLADIVEGTDAFVQVVSPDYRWLAINKAAADEFESIFGTRPKAGDNMLDLLADQPAHQTAVRAIWSRALAGEEFTEVGEFGDPDRARRFYEMRYNVLRDAQGGQVGAYQFVYDVTDRIAEQNRLAEAEAARAEADALYRAYFENTPEALFVVAVEPDGGFRIEEVNPAHEADVGFALAEIRGKRIEEFIPPDLAETILKHYRRAIGTGQIQQYRELFHLHGEPQHWDTSLVPVRDETGRIVRLIGASRNVTRQVVAEDSLRQSQKMEAIGQLTGGVAHDFNNLLTPIIGVLDLLDRRRVGDERERRLIAGASQSAERARTLVQRLLAFARRQPLQPTAVNVAALVSGMADLVDSTTGPQIEVSVDIADDLPPAQADANQLEMAILNLAVNARDAMPDGGELRIAAASAHVAEARGELPPGDYLRLSVADTGVGMDEATLARAAEPFFSTKGVGKGTGLGLSMVHGLASQLGGALTIDSRAGQGTTIELWLPLSERPLEAPRAAPPPIPQRPAGGGRALLVDDEPDVRQITAALLGELGFEVAEAGSAEEAMAIVERGGPLDLLVTDHLMPGQTGSDLARDIRATRPDLPVLVISGYAEGDGIVSDLPRLTKPFRKDELAASIATHLRQAASAG